MIFKKISDNSKVSKILALSVSIIFGMSVLIYACFLFILPKAINLNGFTPKIATAIEEQTGFKFDIINAKIQTTWRLGVKVYADKILLKYTDGSNFIVLTNPSVEINLPTLLFRHLNLDKIYVKNAELAFSFKKDKTYTIEQHVNIINKNLKENENQQSSQKIPIELKNINIEVQSTKITLNDENVSKTFILNANNSKISLSSLNGPLKIKSSGYIGAIENKNNFIDFDVNLYTKLPSIEENIKQDNIAQNFKMDFNPLTGLDKFSFHSKITADLKINELGEKFNAKGYFNIDDITLNLNSYSLPKSFIKTKFDKNIINTRSNIYISKDELLKADNSMSVGKKSKIELNIKTKKINLSSLKTLLASIFEMLAIKNDIKSAIASGYFNCDFNLKSDLKSVNSAGKLQLYNGNIKYPKIGLDITNTVSLLDFSNNKISIKDTHTYLNGSKLAISGTIDTNTNTNVKITSDPLKITDIIKLGKQIGIVKDKDIKDYSFTGGIVTVLLDIKGNFKNITPIADIKVENLAMSANNVKMPVKIDKISITAQPDEKDKKNFLAKVEIQNINAALSNPKLTINAPKCMLNADLQTIELEPLTLNVQGTKIDLLGNVKNYMSKPEINISSEGNIAAQTILAFIAQQNKKYISYAGQIPFNTTITGALDDIKIKGNFITNPKNFISIIDIKNISGKENKLNLDVNVKNNNLIINSLAVNSNGADIAKVSGKINSINSNKPQLAPLNIIIPQKISVVIPALGKIAFDADANMALNSQITKPQITGIANIYNFNYPQYKAVVSSATLDFKKNIIDLQAQGVKISDSDFNANAEISSDLGKTIIINSLNFNSNYINADELLKLTSSMPNTQTTAGPSLPINIKKGTGKITKLKSGTIEIQNISFNFNLYNNLFTLSNIIATFADGNITGDATYNIANTKVSVDGIGKSINVKKAASCFVGGSSIIMSGTANGIAKLNYRGNTYDQQIKTMSGQIIFDIANGQYGEAARFERFLHAGNLLSQSLLNWNINQTISAVTSRNTGEFKSINGKISLANGWANITSLESSGPNMSLYITGKYNLLTENSDIKVLGRISSSVVSVLGPLGSFSLNKVVDKLPETGLAILNTIKTIAPTNPLFADISKNDLDKIPELSTISNNSTSKDFQVLINGQLSKTTSIKSFKWANNETDNTQ